MATSQTVFFNVWSPTGTDETDVKFIARVRDILAQHPIPYETGVNGSIEVKNSVNRKEQQWTINVRNGAEALLLAHMLLEPNNIALHRLAVANHKALSYLRASGTGSHLFHLFTLLQLYFQEVENNVVINPVTNEEITYGGTTYNNIFDGIDLLATQFRKIGHIECIDYPILEEYSACVPSFFATQGKKLGVKKVKTILASLLEFSNKPTFHQLTSILNPLGIGISVYTMEKVCLQEQDVKLYKKNYKIIIAEEHMHVVKKWNMKIQATVMLKDMDYYNKLISLRATHIIYEDNSSFVVSGLRYKLETESKLWKFFESIFSYKANYNQLAIDFYDGAGVRAPHYFNPSVHMGTGLDLNSAYSKIVRNPENVFCSSTGAEYTVPYTNAPISGHKFYIVHLQDTAAEPFFSSNIVGMLGKLVIELRDIFKIKVLYSIEGTSFTHGINIADRARLMELDDVLSQDYPTEKQLKLGLNIYIGSLASIWSYNYTTIETSSDKEHYALSLKYGLIYSRRGDTAVITRRYLRPKNNIFLNLSIIDLCRLQVIKLWIAAKALKPNIAIHKIICDNIVFSSTLTADEVTQIQEVTGLAVTTDESLYQFTHTRLPITFDASSYLIRERQVIHPKEWATVINRRESMMIAGVGGLGKSYLVKNSILPYIRSLGHTALSFGSAKENGFAWEDGHIHQWILKSDGIDMILKKLTGVAYIVVDEITLLPIEVLHILELIKKTGIQFIFIGDVNQCESVDGTDNTNFEFFNRLVSYNWLTLVDWHSKCRFTEEYYNFLLAVIESKDVYSYVMQHPSVVKTIESLGINLCWRHKTGEQLPNYSTIHSTQGKTIKSLMTLHELDRLEKKVAYTALSRVGSFADLAVNTTVYPRNYTSCST